MRESMVFYKSFYEALKELDADTYKETLDIIFKYAFDDELPECSGVSSAIFSLIKPQIDANNRKFENGKKGGRPPKNQTETKTETSTNSENQTKTKPKPKQNQTKTKPKPNVNVNVNVNDNVNANDNANYNVNDNDNVIVIDSKSLSSTEKDIDSKSLSDKPKKKKPPKHKYGEFKHVLLTDDEVERLQNDYGDDDFFAMVKILDEAIEIHKYNYNNCNLVMRGWVREEFEKQQKKNKSQGRNDWIDDWLNEMKEGAG